MDEHEWERYLDGDSDLTALYRASQAPPPATPRADARVRAAAQAQIPAPPDATRHPLQRARRWWVPASVAASLVMATSLYLVQRPVVLMEGPPPPAFKAAADRAQESRIAPPQAAPQTLPSTSAMDTARSTREPHSATPERANAAAPAAALKKQPPLPQALQAPVPRQMPERQEQEKQAAEAIARSSGTASEPAPGFGDGGSATEDAALSDPQQWLARIAALAAADQLESARGEWLRFQQRYPEIALPAALSEQLGRSP